MEFGVHFWKPSYAELSPHKTTISSLLMLDRNSLEPLTYLHLQLVILRCEVQPTASSSCSKTRFVSSAISGWPLRAVFRISLYLFICSTTCCLDVTWTLYSWFVSSLGEFSLSTVSIFTANFVYIFFYANRKWIRNFLVRLQKLSPHQHL